MNTTVNATGKLTTSLVTPLSVSRQIDNLSRHTTLCLQPSVELSDRRPRAVPQRGGEGGGGERGAKEEGVGAYVCVCTRALLLSLLHASLP